jgi:lysophospholipid acyltransferase (LPLAT)-like uncharacterized protein
MKLRNPRLIHLLGLLAAFLVRLWMGTLRYRIISADGQAHPTDARRQRYIYALWHEDILFPTRFHERVHALVSQHADGELVAQICKGLRYGVVRGSATRGGMAALLKLLRASRRTHLVLTLDGPRGPRRHVQTGLVYLASRSELPVILLGVGYSHAWRAHSWDRFAVPCPWSEAVCVTAPPLMVPPGLDRAGLEHYRRRIEDQLLAATAAAERLAQRKTKDEGRRTTQSLSSVNAA